MSRQRSLLTVIRDVVQGEVRSAILSLLGPESRSALEVEPAPEEHSFVRGEHGLYVATDLGIDVICTAADADAVRLAGSGAPVVPVVRRRRSPRRWRTRRRWRRRRPFTAVAGVGVVLAPRPRRHKMAKAEEAWTQLATRIPKELHRRLKLYCVTYDIALMDFVTETIEEKLGRKTRPKKGPA